MPLLNLVTVDNLVINIRSNRKRCNLDEKSVFPSLNSDFLKNEQLSKETQPTSDGNLQESRGGKSTSPLSASPLLRTKTCEFLTVFYWTYLLPVKQTPLPPCLSFSAAESGRKRNPLLFDDDQTDDLLDALGFDANNNNSKKKEQASWLNSDR